MKKIIKKYDVTGYGVLGIDKIAELEDGKWYWLVPHNARLTKVPDNYGWDDLDVRSIKTYEAINSGALQPYWSLSDYTDAFGNSQTTQALPKNNDGRDTCYSCEAPTKTVMAITSQYQVCTRCGK